MANDRPRPGEFTNIYPTGVVPFGDRPSRLQSICVIERPEKFGLPPYAEGYELRRDPSDGQLYAYRHLNGLHIWVQPPEWSGPRTAAGRAAPAYQTVCRIEDPAKFGLRDFTRDYSLLRNPATGQLFAYNLVKGRHVWVQPDEWGPAVKSLPAGDAAAPPTANYGVDRPELQQAPGTVLTNDPTIGRELVAKSSVPPDAGLGRGQKASDHSTYLWPGVIVAVAMLFIVAFRRRSR